MRLRTDLAIYAPGQTLAVKVRADSLDNLVLGSLPNGTPSASTTQNAPKEAISIKRAYGEALLPFGLLAAGRMGSHWGLGILTNGGDCLDCDSGDAADRIALITPLAGHIFALAYDFSAIGPLQGTTTQPGHVIDVEPSVDVHTITLAAMKYENDNARIRRRNAGKTTVEYGAYFTYRWQNNDIPASYLPIASPVAITDAEVMHRGYEAAAADAWGRLTFPNGRIEAEVAYLQAQVDQPSLIPGALLRESASSHQLGAALESEIGTPQSRFGAGLDLGYASGDSAPGFGVNTPANAQAPKPGDLDGPQASFPNDTRVDNFRFHPDYRIDQILFREIIGTVTDAAYIRPHVRAKVVSWTSAQITASLAGIASTAIYASSTPGNAKPLGIELDPQIAYSGREGLFVAIEGGALLPLAGLDNPEMHLNAKMAGLVRLRIAFLF
ncbi:MAG TPA: TIGR04551 family protein, partial [Polyangiaceae bacterium]